MFPMYVACLVVLNAVSLCAAFAWRKEARRLAGSLDRINNVLVVQGRRRQMIAELVDARTRRN